MHLSTLAHSARPLVPSRMLSFVAPATVEQKRQHDRTNPHYPTATILDTAASYFYALEVSLRFTM